MPRKGPVEIMSSRFAVGLIGMVVLCTGLACQRSVGQVQAESAYPMVTVTRENAKLAGLHDDIRLLGMLNRLQLSAEQINRLLPATEKLQQQRAAAQAELVAMEGDVEKALAQKRRLLLEDKPVPEGLGQLLQTLQRNEEAAREQAASKLGTSAKAVRALFTPEQLDIVTGQYEAQLQAQELLDWLRGLSDTDFGYESAANAEGLANPDGGFTQEALVKLFQTVRKLSVADYEKERNDYAKQLSPLYGASEDEENLQIAGAFSHPHMADLLRGKLKVIGDEAP